MKTVSLQVMSCLGFYAPPSLVFSSALPQVFKPKCLPYCLSECFCTLCKRSSLIIGQLEAYAIYICFQKRHSRRVHHTCKHYNSKFRKKQEQRHTEKLI